jgi:hypothetical protein
MPSSTDNVLDPIHDNDVPKIDDAVAVGEDLEFQERWWTFERVIWSFFALLLIADALGVFGAGWLAHRTATLPGSGMSVHYDGVLRTGTPSMIAVQFGPDAPQRGVVLLQVSNSVIKDLDAQRVIPQPQISATDLGHMTYTFPVNSNPGEVQFEVQPASPGVRHFKLQIPGHEAIEKTVVVLP